MTEDQGGPHETEAPFASPGEQGHASADDDEYAEDEYDDEEYEEYEEEDELEFDDELEGDPRGEPDEASGAEGAGVWSTVDHDELPAIWAAVEAIDTHVVELEEEAQDWAVPDNVAGAFEEVRDHLAAAFDVVRELATNLVPIAEQLEILASETNDVDVRLTAVAEAIDGRFARVEQGMAELADWIEGRFSTLEEAIGNDLDDLGEQVSSVTGRPPGERRTASSESPPPPSGLDEEFVVGDDAVAEPGTAPHAASHPEVAGSPPGLLDAALSDVAERLDEVAAQLGGRQDQLEAQLTRLTEEIAGYRRRVQIHARPPVITDEQLETVVAGIVAALGEHQRTGADAKSRNDRRSRRGDR